MTSKMENTLLAEGNHTIIGTAIAGEDNLLGPMVSCSIILDYTNIPTATKKFIQGKKINKEELATIMRNLVLSNFCVVAPPQLNAIGDRDKCLYWTNFKAANKTTWQLLLKKKIPGAYITAQYPLKEVVKNCSNSLQTTNSKVSEYSLWNKSPSLELYVPKATFKVDTKVTSTVGKLAKKLAELYLHNILVDLDKQIPKYRILETTREEQIELVKAYGNSIHHRVYIKELKKYPIMSLIRGT